jgi:hypothetical protein
MWLHKFSRLLYIAYLDCEKSIKNISFVVIGVLSGFLFFSLFIPDIELPFFSAYVLYAVITIATWNALVVTAIVYFWVLALVFLNSFMHVAYKYDNKSWGYVHSAKGSGAVFKAWVWRGVHKFNTQAKADENEAKLIRYHHDVMIDGMIEEVKRGE